MIYILYMTIWVTINRGLYSRIDRSVLRAYPERKTRHDVASSPENKKLGLRIDYIVRFGVVGGGGVPLCPGAM